MNSYRDLLLEPSSTIKEALTIIDKGAMKLALVVDLNEKLIGTLSDGDIRRGLLNNLTLEDSIDSIIYKTPTVCHVNDPIDKIIKIAIAKKVYQVPIIDDNGCLVKIQDLGNMLSVAKRTNYVVLMAGGLGTRLQPLTNNIPKPLLKVGNQPILETIINNFAKYGFCNIIISVNYKSNMIIDYFGDGSKFGVNISYIHEKDRLGTAGALSLLKDKPSQSFFVMNGDILTNINFEHLLDYHIVESSDATMCVREYDFKVPYGVIEVENQSIKSIEEKPSYKFFVNAGIYVLSPKILDEIPHNQYFDMPTLFDNLIKQQQKVLSFPIHEYWLDIGRIDEYEKANIEFETVF